MPGLPQAERAVILGSGLALGQDRFVGRERIPYGELGWPVTGVPGHPSVVTVATSASDGATVLLAGGRPHRYEGWTDEELERPARDLLAAGVTRLLLICACGALRPDLSRGDLCVAGEVVDLQRPPEREADRLRLCSAAAATAAAARAAEAAAASAGPSAAASAGPSARVLAVNAYAAVAGPHYETPAEAAWLAGLADVVGMSAAPEARAAREYGIGARLLAVVTNASGESLGHGEVLHTGAGLGSALTAVVAALLQDEELWP